MFIKEVSIILHTGKCVCNAEFTGADCSVHKNAVPKLFDLPSAGVCDKATRPCAMTPVFADVYFESEQLTCQFEHTQVSKGKKLRSALLFINNNKLSTLFQVYRVV